MFYTVVNISLQAYIITIFIFFMVCLVSSSARTQTYWFLNYANLILFFPLLLNLIATISKMISCVANQDFSYLYSNCWMIGIWSLIFGGWFQLLFVKSKYRKSILLTIVSVIFVLVLLYHQVLLLAPFFTGDFYATNWSFHYKFSNTAFFIHLLASILYFSTCWALSKNKLVEATQHSTKG